MRVSSPLRYRHGVMPLGREGLFPEGSRGRGVWGGLLPSRRIAGFLCPSWHPHNSPARQAGEAGDVSEEAGRSAPGCHFPITVHLRTFKGRYGPSS